MINLRETPFYEPKNGIIPLVTCRDRGEQPAALLRIRTADIQTG